MDDCGVLKMKRCKMQFTDCVYKSKNGQWCYRDEYCPMQNEVKK